MIYNPGRPLLIQGHLFPSIWLIYATRWFSLKHAFGVLADGAASRSLTLSPGASLQLSCCRSTHPEMQQQPPPPPPLSSSSAAAAGGGGEALEDPFDDYDIVIPPDFFMELDYDGSDGCAYGTAVEDAQVGCASSGGSGGGEEEDDRLSLVYKGFSYVFDSVPPQKVRGGSRWFPSERAGK